MDEDIRRQIGQLFGDAPDPPKPPAQETLSQKLRAAREQEILRLARQDRAVEQIQALATEAGIEVEINVPDSPLRRKEAGAGKRGRRDGGSH